MIQTVIVCDDCTRSTTGTCWRHPVRWFKSTAAVTNYTARASYTVTAEVPPRAKCSCGGPCVVVCCCGRHHDSLGRCV